MWIVIIFENWNGKFGAKELEFVNKMETSGKKN